MALAASAETGTVLDRRPVVALENDQRIFELPGTLEGFHDLADAVVHGGDHRGVHAALTFHAGETLHVSPRSIHRVVRRVVGNEQKKWRRALSGGGVVFGNAFPNEPLRLSRDHIRQVAPLLEDLFAVVVEVVKRGQTGAKSPVEAV